jgi:hypothetical protein
VSEEARESDFERESSRLSEGLKSCRAVMDNYRAMMTGDAQSDDDEGSDMSRYVSTTSSTSAGYETDSGAN